MEVILGKHAGFCFGVKRAVEQAYREGMQHPCATLGALIHNPQEVERLRTAGIRVVHGPEEVRKGETLILRSHGVGPDVIAQAAELGIPIIDLTCPHVAHVHELVRNSADPVIIIGEPNHPEVKGIAGWAKAPVVVIPTVDAAKACILPEHATVVAQTTLRRETFDAVLEVLRQRIPVLTVHRTICSATGQRQEEARKLARDADAVIVVGGQNSSNTNKLLETCAETCPRSILVETPEDIPEGFLREEDRVAVTAGASTPPWLLEVVCARIHGTKS